MTYHIEYSLEGNYVSFYPDAKMPCMLADQIKEVIKNFYKED